MRQPLPFGALAAALVPIAAVVALDPAGWYPFGPAKFGAVATTVLAAVAGCLWSWRRGPITHIARMAGVLWIALLGWLSLATVFGADGWYALIGTPERRLGLLTWGLFGGAWWVGTQLGGRGRRWWARAAVAAGVWCGGYAFVEQCWRAPVETSSITDRIGGPFGSAAYFAAALCLLVPIAGGVLADRGEPRWWRIAAGCSVVSGLFALIGTGTRGAWVGVVCSALVVAVVLRPARRLIVAVGAVLLVVGLLMVPTLNRLVDRDGAETSRLDEWAVAARVIAEHPVVGAGPEGYRIVVSDGIDDHYERTYGRAVQPDRAHSAPLDVAVIGGLPALAVYLGLISMIAIAAVRTIRDGDPVRVGVAAGVIAYGVQQFVLFPLAEVDPMYWLGVGLLMASDRPESDDHASEDSLRAANSSTSMRAGAVFVAMLAVGVFATSVVGVAADRLARDAVRGEDASVAAGRAAELRPDVVRYHLLVASVAAAEQSVDGVDREIAAAERAAAISPGDPIVQQAVARSLLHRAQVTGGAEDVADAIDAWRRLTVDDPHCQPCFLGLGSALFFADGGAARRDEAVAALRRAAELSRSDDDRARQALAALGVLGAEVEP